MNNYKIMAGLLGLALTAVAARAAAPSLSYKINGNEFIITYTGTLYQSSDAVSWTEVASASSPYVVTLGDKKLFFCAKGEEGPSENITIPLSDTVNLDMIWIEPGTFIMGSPEDELGRGDNETQHEVTLTRGYWLGKYEVTQAQYEAVMGTNPSYFKGADLPVENVNWFEALAFCEKLTAIAKAAGLLPEGYEYTLPTEAQWEYACRAGTTTAFNNGTNIETEEQIKGECPNLDPVGWYDDNSNYTTTTHPVGQKQPNAWGLYDMHGNVEEWCLDWWGDYPTSSVTDPTGPATGDYRMQRGGSCDGFTYAGMCRSAERSRGLPGSINEASCYTGFRVALAPLTKTKNMTIPLSEDVDLDMIWIEPGTFMMGSVSELGSNDDETWHGVTLTQGYWLGKYEVTQAQYEAVMGTNPSYFKGADLPVEQVSWYDATNFCAKLTARERAAGRLPAGYEYTLPTEAQWEYACRAGTWTALNSGENLSDEEQCPEMDKVGWYYYNSDSKPHPVGQKQPNAWGLYDMHGNVYEWCLDWYGDYPIFSVTDPTGPATGDLRVQRSGSRVSTASSCRSAFRSNSFATSRYRQVGFRVALALVKNMTIPLSEDVDLNLTWIKPGTSMMGSPERELGRFSDETWHNVTLTKGYWMGKYEVTQAQYEAVMGTNPSKWKGADLPVEQVSWYDATNFCAKLTEIEKAAGRLPEGYEYTLPTEAQWEYACRAETWTALNSGKNLSDKEKCPEMDEVGWYGYNSGHFDSDGNYTDNGKSFPAGQKQPNAWGLYDMHGNVAEWCLDWRGAYPAASVTDPKGAGTGSDRVIRGGSWYHSADYCRSANRLGGPPIITTSNLGFRVALALVSESKDMSIPLSEDVDLDMIWIEPGTFLMGSPENELGRDNDEKQHQVTLTKGYWMGQYEVTQAQYEVVMGTNPSWYWYKGFDLPVESVSWNDAMDFCARLTTIERAAGRLPEGYEYTLPTEAQWEYACRAGTTTALNSGKNLSDDEQCPEMDEVGWYWYNGGKENYDQDLTCTHPVGQMLPNAWGFYDMHGNVEEWCLDWYGSYPSSSVTDPKGTATGSKRVMRGGSWSNIAIFCRSAERSDYRPDGIWNRYGFRVVLAPVK